MEREEIELDALELEILEELIFSTKYDQIMHKLNISEVSLKNALGRLLEAEFVAQYFPGPDEKIEFENENFNKFYRESYYLATKRGLIYFFTQ